MIPGHLAAQQLVSITKKYTEVFVREDHTAIMVFMVQGGRCIGLYPCGELCNVLWTNPQYEDAVRMMQPDVGGDRLWIAPERKFFYENPRDFEGYHIPFEIDPGDYQFIEDSVVRFRNTFSLLEYDSNNVIDDNTAERSFIIIPDPYDSHLPFAGVSIEETLTINAPSIRMAALSKTMVFNPGPESPGCAIFPLRAGFSYLSYGTRESLAAVEKAPDHVRIRIAGAPSNALAISPEACPSDTTIKSIIAAPLSPKSRNWFCLMKRSADTPTDQEGCVDSPRHDPKGEKAVSIIHDGSFLDEKTRKESYFCEASLFLNRGTSEDATTVSRGTHELLSYIGEYDDIRDLIATATGCSTISLLFER